MVQFTFHRLMPGQARGTWFFEASFPVVLVDWDGKIIAQTIATAKSDWMTEEFVPFEATLTFTADEETYSNKGSLILQKDNPSGLPEHDDALEIPVTITDSKIIRNGSTPIITGTQDEQGQIKLAPGDMIVCTADAKECPDGSYVSRTGPNCQFATCPQAK